MLADRSNVTFITGPSRTADIELTLTLGVHGPREVHVLIVRDPPGTTDRPASA
jgi:L-lactate dehydrogenase complex protein LldG